MQLLQNLYELRNNHKLINIKTEKDMHKMKSNRNIKRRVMEEVPVQRLSTAISCQRKATYLHNCSDRSLPERSISLFPL